MIILPMQSPTVAALYLPQRQSAGVINSCLLRSLNREWALILVDSDPLS